MAQQTAVDWLIEQLEVFVTLDEELTWDKMFDKAKAIEKEQIMDARNNGIVNTLKGYSISNEEYYNETYNK